MRKYHKLLVTLFPGRRMEHISIGNHKVTGCHLEDCYLPSDDGHSTSWEEIKLATRLFSYHDNIICVVDDESHKFWLTHHGWDTPSTNAALAGYREYFESIGYENVNQLAVYKYERKGN